MSNDVLEDIAQQIHAVRSAFHACELSTLPADRATTERIITGFYARIGEPAPQFRWLGGPLSCVLAYNAIDRLGAEARVRMRGMVIDTRIKGALRNGLRRQLADAARRQLSDEVLTALGATRWLELEDYDQDHDGQESAIDEHLLYASEGLWVRSVWENRCPFNSRFGRELQYAIRSDTHQGFQSSRAACHWGDVCRDLGLPPASAPPGPLVWPSPIWGGEAQCWVGYHMACIRAGAEPEPSARELLEEWDALNRACGWWFPCKRMVFCAERHARIQLDSRDRLHGEHGPAIECRDGYKLFRWHGTAVPPEWIERRKALDPMTALTWPNIEQRRAALEIIGWSTILNWIPSRVIDADRDTGIGTLLECELPNVGSARFLRVRCGTGREFVLSVPRGMRTAREANAWTYGLDENEYQPEARS